MVAATQHTDPGHPHPGYGSTGALAHLAEPSGNDGRYPRPLPLLPAEHAQVPHQDHPNGASELVSLPLLVLQQPHPLAVSPLAAVPPAALAPGIPPPPAHARATSAHTPTNKQTKVLVSIHQKQVR
jgi:hypothetical protein